MPWSLTRKFYRGINPWFRRSWQHINLLGEYFHFRADPELHQTMVAAQGGLHLDVVPIGFGAGSMSISI
jgi:hypothetical protein